MRHLSRIPSWIRMTIAAGLMIVLTNLPDTPGWLWYVKRAVAFMVFVWAAYEVMLTWHEFNRVRKEEGEDYYITIRLSWPMVAVIGFGIVCVLLLVTQLLRGG